MDVFMQVLWLGTGIAILSGLENTEFYVRFADTAHFDWVTEPWRAVFTPNQVHFVGLLAVMLLRAERRAAPALTSTAPRAGRLRTTSRA